MTEASTTHPGLKLLRLVISINRTQRLLRFVAGRVQEFERIFDIMNPLAQENEAIIVPGFVEKVLGLSKRSRASIGLFELKQSLLNIKDPLVRLILGPGKKGLPSLQGFIEPLSMTVDTGLANGLFDIS